MNQLVTQAIVLTRTDYGEADRILTVLTPQYGKLRLLAKGVRRIKSKLAGGIELFSVSEITYIKGRGDIGTLVSTRLVTHYGHIVEQLDRTMTGYELIKQLHKVTEDEAELDYFTILQATFEALNDHTVPLSVITIWFAAQMLRVGGHEPNLRTDTAGSKLEPGMQYDFNFENMAFQRMPEAGGRFGADHIKLLRLIFSGHTPKSIAKIEGNAPLIAAVTPLIDTMRRTVT